MTVVSCWLSSLSLSSSSESEEEEESDGGGNTKAISGMVASYFGGGLEEAWAAIVCGIFGWLFIVAAILVVIVFGGYRALRRCVSSRVSTESISSSSSIIRLPIIVGS